MENKLLFSVTKNDFEFQTFCTGGKGGQHRNAKQNGVRCIHRASGAVGEHRDGRDQYRNKIEAFHKCVATPEFKMWHKQETMRRLGQLKEVEKEVEAAVDRAMNEKNLKVEYFEP